MQTTLNWLYKRINVCLIYPKVVNDFDVGVNESIFLSFVCPITHMNAQTCY